MGDRDIYLKLLTQSLSGGALQAWGLEDVELAEELPTALPAGEMHVDTVWRMVDERVFHLEFQTQREPTLYRFLEYDARLVRRYRAPVRTVVLYPMPVTAAPDTVDWGTIHYHVENVYLSHFRGEDALEMVAKHVAAERWEPADRLRLALALCMPSDDRLAVLAQTLDLVHQIPTPSEADLVTATIMAFAEPMLSDEEMQILAKELSTMSKILERVEPQGIKKGIEQGIAKVVRAMVAEGESLDKIARVTGLTPSQIKALHMDPS